MPENRRSGIRARRLRSGILVSVTIPKLIGYWRLDGTPRREQWRTTVRASPDGQTDGRVVGRSARRGERMARSTTFCRSGVGLKRTSSCGCLPRKRHPRESVRGLSSWRFCGRYNGSAEMIDGVYCWPEGLAHLCQRPRDATSQPVRHPRQRGKPPSDSPRPTFDEKGQRNRSWASSQFGPRIWQPDDGEMSDGMPYVGLESIWWLRHTGS